MRVFCAISDHLIFFAFCGYKLLGDTDTADAKQIHEMLTALVVNAGEAGASSVEISVDRRTLHEKDARFWLFTGEAEDPYRQDVR